MAIGDWIAPAGGNWVDAVNWDFGAVPNSVSGFANFLVSAAAPGGATGFRDIDLQGATYTVGFLNFESDANSWYRPTNGTINLQVSGGNAFIFDASAPAASTLVSTEIAADVNLSNDASFSVANALTTLEISGNVGGTGEIVKFGDGRLFLTGTNTVDIGTINAGTLAIGGSNASFGNNFNGATITNNGTLEFSPFGSDLTLDATIVGTGDIVINAINSKVFLRDGDFESTGAVRVLGGTLEINFDFRLNDASTVEVSGLGVLDLADTWQEGINGLSGNGRITSTDGGFGINRFGLDLTSNQTFTGTFESDIQLEVNGSSIFDTLNLGGFSTHTGDTIVTNATVNFIGAAAGFQNSKVVLSDGILSVTDYAGFDPLRIADLEGATGTLNDILLGGSGLRITDADAFLTPNNSLRFFGDNGTADLLQIEMNDAGTTMDLTAISLFSWEGDDRIEITGTSAANDITGSAVADLIDAAAGNFTANDTVDGGGGNDTIIGGRGDDSMDGGAGFDYVDYFVPNFSSGGAPIVTVDLGNTGAQNTGVFGTDTLTNIEGLMGSQFRDDFTGDGDANHLTGNAGDDTLTGGGNDDTLEGGADNDRLEGDDGNDVLNGGLGGDVLDGGNGIDTATYIDATADVIASLTAPGLNAGEADGDSYTSIENLTGSNLNDELTGDANTNTIRGEDGNDNLRGEGGADVLSAGDGNDIVNGGDGADVMFGGAGNDLMFGGAGFDRMFGGAGTDRLFGGDANDIANGGANNDIINTGAGNDLIFAQNGNDLVFAQGGNDNIFAGTGNDKVFGGSGNDDINLGAGNDEVFAGSGVDMITGAGGNDIMSGGGGVDTFFFAANQGADRITDFTAIDRLDIGAFGVTDGGASDQDWQNATTSVMTSGGGADVTIAWDGGGSLILENTTIASLSDALFIF